MKRPNRKDYDFNDYTDCLSFSSQMIKYLDFLEKKDPEKGNESILTRDEALMEAPPIEGKKYVFIYSNSGVMFNKEFYSHEQTREGFDHNERAEYVMTKDGIETRCLKEDVEIRDF